MNPIFFPNQDDFRTWLKLHHQNETELLVGFYKIGSGKPSMTWSQSVDQALCFGWIDSKRKSIDEERYCIRFTPRKKTSKWSAVNIKKVQELTKAGLMTEAGLTAFSWRNKNSINDKTLAFPKKLEILFKKNKTAWTFFKNQTHSYKKSIFYWIACAKHEKTQLSRLEKTISESEKQRRIKFM